MWKKADVSANVQKLCRDGYPKLTALVMANAGVENKEQAEEFLYSETVHDPAKIRNIEKNLTIFGILIFIIYKK